MTKKAPTKKHVLLVEDDEFLLRSYKTKFKKFGIEADIAHNGKEAMEKAKATKPSLILLDIVMPVQDGFDFLREFNKAYGIGAIPIIALTNLGQDENIERGKKLGVAEYMVKAHHSMQEVVDMVLKYLK